MNMNLKSSATYRIIALVLLLCVALSGFSFRCAASEVEAKDNSATFVGRNDDAISETEVSIDAIGTVTYKSGNLIKTARMAYNALNEDDRERVENYQTLVNAESAMKRIADEFSVTVTGWSTNSFPRTPWMETDKISEADKQLSRDAMADEMKYQYVERGYRLGIVQGTKAIDNWSSYALGFGSDDNKELNDNVGNPWGSSDTRHWAFVSTAFAGIAFSESGYMSQRFSNSTPISNSFTYNGRVYQMFTAGIRSHEDVPLVKDNNKNTGITVTASTTLRAGGKNEDVTNNTFTYAYARYNQEHKWENKVVGVPKEAADPVLSKGVLYKAFEGPDGDAYIAGDYLYISSDEAAAKKNDGKQTGAYVIAGKFAEILQNLDTDISTCFEKTGAPISDEYQTSDGVRQNFVCGYMLVSDDYSGFVIRDDEDIIGEVENLIEGLPDIDGFKLTDEEALKSARKAYDQLREDLKESVKNHSKLIDLEERLNDLKAAANAEVVINEALPASGKIRIANKPKIYAALELYQELTGVQQGLVVNYESLLSAVVQIFSLETQVKEVADEIAALVDADELKFADIPFVCSVRAKFDLLSPEQQALVINSEKLWLLEMQAEILEETPRLESQDYVIDRSNGYISGVAAQTTIDRFKSSFKLNNIVIETNNAAFIATGDVLMVMNGDTIVESFTVAVIGDMDGNGIVNVSDVVVLRTIILNQTAAGVALTAGDIDSDGRINVSDVVSLRTMILNNSVPE